jgi:hypothetical protein
MSKGIQAKITAIGRPLRVELSIDGPWLERLKSLLRDMDDSSYPMEQTGDKSDRFCDLAFESGAH